MEIDLAASKKNRNHRRSVLGAGGFAHFIHDGFTDTLFILLPLWAEAFGLSHTQVGALKMMASGALASFQVPSGLLAEKIGERSVLVLGTILAGLGFLALGLAGGFTTLLICMFIVGLGCSTQHPLASALVSKAYHGGARRAALGIYNFAGDVGKVAISVSVASIAAAYGWKTGAMSYGVVGVVAGGTIYFALGRIQIGGRPKTVSSEEKAQSKDKGWGITDMTGFASLSAIGMIDTMARLGFLTFMPFLLVQKGAAVDELGFALGLILAGGAAGKLVCGLIAERAGILRTVVLTEIASVAGIFLLIDLPLGGAMFLLPFLGVALNGTSSVLYGTVGDFIDADRQARAFGLFYTLAVGMGAISPLVYGLVSDAFGLEITLSILAASIILTLPLCLLLKSRLKG